MTTVVEAPRVRSPARGRHPYATLAEGDVLVAEVPQGPLGEAGRRASVRPDDPPPRDTTTVPGQHGTDLARPTPADHLGQVAVRGHRTGRHGLDEAQNLFDVAICLRSAPARIAL